ncbi:MAG TPA: MEDS domain-containing protein, partial [Kineosporiaceae bacterium]|nr:MEDS domain-containing protein [Kineosporiaceae bacterium]
MAIPAIGKAPWGTHFCQFHDTKQDLLDILVPFFGAGLESNEQCVWVTCEPLGVDEATEALGREVGDLERRIADGQISIWPHPVYSGEPEGFDAEAYLDSWSPMVAAARTKGFDGLRISADSSPEDALRMWKPFMEYESVIGPRLASEQVVALCTYPMEMCDLPRMLDVLTRHKFALVKHGDWTLIEPSEQKMATAAVERMNIALAERTAELQSALADLRGFSQWVTHDLRAPLASIASFGDLLAEEWEDQLDERGRGMLERIRSGAARMDQLIAATLAYSQVQNATLDLHPLDLAAIVTRVWPTVAGAGRGRRAALHVGELPMAFGDRELVTQALTALLSNASKFTAHQPDPLVEVGARTEFGETVYYVRDNGIGFEAADAEAIFGAFTRMHS